MLKRKKQRCERVITRLEAQLKAKTKPMKSGKGSTKNEFVEFKGVEPLTDKDIARINKELNLLKTY